MNGSVIACQSIVLVQCKDVFFVCLIELSFTKELLQDYELSFL